MDPVQDHAAAQESADVASAASLTASADPDVLSSPLAADAASAVAETGEIEVVCIQPIQSRELGVIAEPGERRIIPPSRLEAFLMTEAFQVLGPVVRPQAPAPAKPARRSKTE
jgi:hypothetical protein